MALLVIPGACLSECWLKTRSERRARSIRLRRRVRKQRVPRSAARAQHVAV